MTPSKAAKIIGCHVRHVRSLIARGKLRATRHTVFGRLYYDVGREEAERYRDTVQSRGWPRGKPRSNKENK